ncbi:MAG: microcin C transport system permease protein [Verrucomicrobiales bacterium]|jgi:microcin C transport system permease protein
MISILRKINWTRWRRTFAVLLALLGLALITHEWIAPRELAGTIISSLTKLTLFSLLVWLFIFWRPNPLTEKKLRRFRSIRRSFWSFVILGVLLLLSVVAELLINKRPIIVSYEGSWYFPTYTAINTGDQFGLDYPWEVDYRELQRKFDEKDEGNWILWPAIPWDAYEYIDPEIAGYEIGESGKRLRHPLPANLDARILLGTDGLGRDVFAVLFYGFRIVMVSALLYLVGVNLIGVTLGAIMGFFGGKIDLIGQRFVEIWANIPFLYVVIMLIAYVPSKLPTPIRIGLIVFVMIAFSWTSVALYLRSSTFREKARDYVSAGRLSGASTGRIIFVHILPNSIATIITFLPFLVAGAIASLTALDYLGFGIPADQPSWGILLKEGSSQVRTAPWIVTSAFCAMVFVLTLITFIGEGVREAFDPKKFTVYR